MEEISNDINDDQQQQQQLPTFDSGRKRKAAATEEAAATATASTDTAAAVQIVSSSSSSVSPTMKRIKVVDPVTTAATSSTTTTDAATGGTQTIVSPAASETSTAAAAVAAPVAAEADEEEQTLDLATTLGYKDGDRLEVQWEIHNDDDDNDEDNDNKNEEGKDNVDNDTSSSTTTSTTRTVWWKATLLKHDGRTTDSVAIRSLLYDARPDLGFPEPSQEDVVFLGHDLLVSPHDESIQLKFKTEGLTEAEHDAVVLVACKKDDDVDSALEEQLNRIVMGTLQKNEAMWKSMPAAAQAAIADKMRRMKDKVKHKLQDLMMTTTTSSSAQPQQRVVITSETIQKLLAESF